MSRWKAFAIHLVPTLFVAAGVAALFLVAWYPPPLFAGSGSARLLGIILLTLLVTGPVLTLAVFKPGKRGLKLDLAAIALLQCAALAFGLFTAFQTRPAYLAVLPYRATLVRLDQLEAGDGGHARAAAPLWGARAVGVRPPTDDERQLLIAGLFAGEPDVDHRPEYYRPLAERMARLRAEAVPFRERLAAGDASSRHYREWLRQSGRESSDTLYLLPLILPAGEAELVIDADAASVAGYLPAPPPQ